MKLLLTGGRVIDPANKINDKLDMLVEDGKISKLGKNLKADKAEIFDFSGKIIVPGLIDMHVHLREPGFEYKETIETGTRAALAGGVTSVACMPNTEPVIDNAAVVELVVSKSKREGAVNVYPIASLTKGGKCEEVSELGSLAKSGAIAFSDDAAPVMNAELMRRAMEYGMQFGLPIICHCEDKNMTLDGVMNEGFNSTTLGLRGMPDTAESIMVYRNIAIANYTGAKVHIAHVSCKKSVEIIRWAKKTGLKVTCETAPHYFTLTDDAVKSYGTNTKMNPPLRLQSDVEAVLEGLADGTIDCIATDHAPHGKIDKEVEYNYAAFGITGLETLLPLTLSELVEKKVLGLEKAVELMTWAPAKILGLKKGTLKEGSDADITIIDAGKEYTIDVKKFHSKGKNSPFDGRKVKGVVEAVIVGGVLKFNNGKILQIIDRRR